LPTKNNASVSSSDERWMIVLFGCYERNESIRFRRGVVVAFLLVVGSNDGDKREEEHLKINIPTRMIRILGESV